MNRPQCQFGGCGGCLSHATWMVGIAHDFRFKFSCDEHRDRWNKHGDMFCWIAKLVGYLEEADMSERVRANADEKHPLHEAVRVYKAAKAMAADFDRTGMWL